MNYMRNKWMKKGNGKENNAVGWVLWGYGWIRRIFD